MLHRVVIAAVALFSLAAGAQQESRESLPLERFRVPIDNTGFGTTEGGGIPDHLNFQVGYVTNYTLNPLVFRDETGARVDAIVAHRLAGDFVATIGILDYVAIGVDLPMTLLQIGGSNTPDSISDGLQLAQGLTTIGMGDLKVVPKIRILREDRHFVSLSIIPAFTLPTASGVNFGGSSVDFNYGGSYLGEGPFAFSFLPEIALSSNFYGVRMSGNLQWRLRPPFLYLGVIPVNPDITYRAAVGYDVADMLRRLERPQLAPVLKWMPSLLFYAEIFGATADRNPFGLIPADPNATEEQKLIREREVVMANALEWSAGVRYHIVAGVQVEAGVGSGLIPGYGSPDLRVYGGVRYAFTRKDKDEDGLLDAEDACPSQPEDKDGFEDSDGCPDTDNDGDGLPDGSDKCPDDAEDVDGFEDADGCPELDNDKDGTPDGDDRCPEQAGPTQNQGCPISDRDGDGTADDEDKCPDEPGPAERAGCPVRDGDQDGVPDEEDMCPEEKGPAELKGCPPKDRDKDGIDDSTDKCPDSPGPVERQGCPLGDRDLDGVLDKEDKCPDEAGPANRKGCPIPDKDGDGIEDKIDKCPTEPGPAMLEGCPDKDGDGVADKHDKCPDKAGLAMFEGCPDSDKDGVPDDKDKCPDEPEVINGVKDDDGCPDEGKQVVVVTKEKIEIKEKVFFATGSARIQRKSFSLLDQVGQVLAANPEIKKIRIEGHTDSQGSASSNKRLSQRRADSVKVYLIKYGVDPAVLESVGYGEEQPIADNGTAEGRSENRREEFVIVERE